MLVAASAMAPHLLVIDNYDSFTYNLVQYVGELGARVDVFKNDAIDVEGVRARAPTAVLISPGPCTPNEAGITLELIAALATSVPIFGVCLGHQAIGQPFGGRVVRAGGRETVGVPGIRAAFEAILAGKWTPVQVGAFAVALRMRGESAEEIVGAAQAMRAAMLVVEHDLPIVVDTCGTGGDGAHTLNLSSAAAVVVAACGLFVAKHGNRSASSRCGGADVFERLRLPSALPPSRQGAWLA